MLAEYKNGWEKEDFSLTGESYHTDYSDFTVHYKVPQGYSVFSSVEQDAKEGTNNGTVSMKHIKEFYIAIVFYECGKDSS
ncbi:hypothetical protein QNH39_14890 [Neobacillus novalis]|uniref:Uncharacterized protein n=1 Tax=Neobacillus novalis TaxID=220687 RepID=A0AA95MHX2_9BACI|nr:hypothetical protein [Neobacillus novalis]WHY83971.1 hypothetical protein QNH39_14890 [Neobacillus novalis]